MPEEFWTAPYEIPLLGYVLTFDYPKIAASTRASWIERTYTDASPNGGIPERDLKWWELLRDDLISIGKEGEPPFDREYSLGMWGSTLFAPYVINIARAVFFRDTLIAMGRHSGGLGGPGTRSEGSGEDTDRGNGREVSGLPDDMPCKGAPRLRSGGGAPQRGLVSGVREESGAVTGDAPALPLAGSNGRRGRVSAGRATGGSVGRTRKTKA